MESINKELFKLLRQNRRQKRLCVLLGLAAVAAPAVSQIIKNRIADVVDVEEDEREEESCDTDFENYYNEVIRNLQLFEADEPTMLAVHYPDFLVESTLHHGYQTGIDARDMAFSLFEALTDFEDFDPFATTGESGEEGEEKQS